MAEETGEKATPTSVSLRGDHRRIVQAIMEAHGLPVTAGFSPAVRIALEEWAARNPAPGREVAA